MLLESASGRSRSSLLADLPDNVEAVLLADPVEGIFREMVEKRSRGIPVAYITGVREFYGLPFAVGPGVLVPRPETEVLVEATIERIRAISSGVVDGGARGGARGKAIRYLDCCTGSGCVGIAVVRECIRLGVLVTPALSDMEKGALVWAQRNVDRLVPEEIPWEFLHGPGLDPVHDSLDVISANPPYLTRDETMDVLSRGWGEPERALDGGADGLDCYRALAPQASERLRNGGVLLLECGAHQGKTVQDLCLRSGFSNASIRKDFAGHDRVVIAEV